VQGLRAYLAVPGGFQAQPVMNSIATVTREGLGGLGGLGSVLQRADRLEFTPALTPVRAVPSALRPAMPPCARLRLDLVLGAQYAQFSGRSLFDAFNHLWQVDIRSDRMGVRLTGPRLSYAGGGMVSEGIPLGAIQVPPDGQPFILLNDRQTIGGYPRLGALTPPACAQLAQCPPGTLVQLRPVPATRARERLLELLRQSAR
jgi:5-oxoprolinase (ATP-hydrolysing) subunit C